MIYSKLFMALAGLAYAESFISQNSLKPKSSHLKMSMNEPSNLHNSLKNVLKGLASAALFSAVGTSNPAFAADYTQAAPPPVLSPQIVTKQSIRAGTPEKWIYSKFLDEVEKNDVEKVTFSPDGKRAVGINTDGDRFTVDIPNDPNLLSFLVQHKVEINVAPINANGGVGAESAALVLPESDMDKLIQVNFFFIM